MWEVCSCVQEVVLGVTCHGSGEWSQINAPITEDRTSCLFKNNCNTKKLGQEESSSQTS